MYCLIITYCKIFKCNVQVYVGSKFVQSFDTCLQRAIAHSGTKKTPVYTVLARDRNYIRTIQLILQLAGPMLLPVARESNWRI